VNKPAANGHGEHLARPETEALQVLTGALDPKAAEDPKQLLGAVRRDEAADHGVDEKQTNFHLGPPDRSGRYVHIHLC
jgi:hypothetical protein